MLRRALTSLQNAVELRRRHVAQDHREPVSAPKTDPVTMPSPVEEPQVADQPAEVARVPIDQEAWHSEADPEILDEHYTSLQAHDAMVIRTLNDMIPADVHAKLALASAPAEPQVWKCVTCFEEFPRNKLVSPCRTNDEDLWCGQCLERSIQRAIDNPECMPAKCHNIIHLHYAMPAISVETAKAYQAKFEVWSSKDRIYCPVPSCSASIPPRLMDRATQKDSAEKGKLECPECQIALCVDCHRVSHAPQPCSVADTDGDEMLALLTDWGYKRCPKCKEAVRRMYGCSHMRCVCGASWCWRCLLPIDECVQDECENEHDYDSEDDDNGSVLEVEPWAEWIEEGVELPLLFNESYDRETPYIETAAPEPDRQRVRRGPNLDGGPAERWQNGTFDFGEEPTNEATDHVWCCTHTFRPLNQPGGSAAFAERSSEEVQATEFLCHRCWEVCNEAGVQECRQCWLMCCLECIKRIESPTSR